MYRLLTPLLALIVAITLYATYIKPTLNKYKEIDTEIGRYDAALSKAAELKTRIQELINEKKAIPQSDLERLMVLVPDSIDEVEVIMALDEIANNNRLTLQGLTVQKQSKDNIFNDEQETAAATRTVSDPMLDDPAYDPTLDPDSTGGAQLGSLITDSADIASAKLEDLYEPVTIGFTVTGSYEDFKTFTAELEKSLVLMDVSELSITGQNGEAQGGGEVDSSYAMTISLYQFKNPTL